MMQRKEIKLRTRQTGMADVVPLLLLVVIYGSGVLLVLVAALSIVGAVASFKKPSIKLLALIVVLLFWWRLLVYPGLERRWAAEKREEAISLCQMELANVPNEIQAESVVIESGVIGQDMLESLIGERKLQFVDLKVKKLAPQPAHKERWGVAAVKGDDRHEFTVPETVPYVRIALAKHGGSGCIESSVLGIDLTRIQEPFSPDACLSVVQIEQSTASHILKAVPIPDPSENIKWSIIERSSGRVAAALTSNDRPENPRADRGGSENEYKQVKNGTISCRQAHFSLMTLLHSGQTDDSRLALSRRKIVPQQAIDSEGGPDSWPELIVPEEAVPRWSTSDYDDARGRFAWGKAWEDAFRKAADSGWASIGEHVIDYAAGDLVSLDRPLSKGDPVEGYTRASKDGFVFIMGWRLGKEGVPVVRYSLDGKVVRRVFLRSANKAPVGRFNPAGVEWRQNELLVYGFRHGPQSGVPEVSVFRLAGFHLADTAPAHPKPPLNPPSAARQSLPSPPAQ